MTTPATVLDLTGAVTGQPLSSLSPTNQIGMLAQQVSAGLTAPNTLVQAITKGINQASGGNPTVDPTAILQQITNLSNRLTNPTAAGTTVSQITAEIQSLASQIGFTSPGATNNSQLRIDVSAISDVNNISDNVLSQFVVYQYNISLSMLPIETCTAVQAQLARNPGTIKSIDINTDLAIDKTRTDRSVTIASTGEIKRNFANLRITETQRIPNDGVLVPVPSSLQTPTTNTGGTPSVSGNPSRNIYAVGQNGSLNAIPTQPGSSSSAGTSGSSTTGPASASGSGPSAIPAYTDVTNVIATYDSAEWNYYNIDSVTIENVLSPSANNPAIADMLTMKMRLLEPNGFQFAEDIRQIADGLGYQYVPSVRYMWRVDIWFSGYDQRGNWYDYIPLKSTSSATPIQALSYYVYLATVDAKVDGRGTVYELGFVPSQSWRPEDVVFDSLTITNAGTNNFGQFLDTLAQAMQTSRANASAGNIKRNYEFYAPDMIRSSVFNSEKFFNKKNMLSPAGGDAKAKAKDVDVIKLLEDAWADCTVMQDLFLSDGPQNAGFLQPRIMMMIEFNTVYGSSMSPNTSPPTDNTINDFDTITHQYKIVPYVTFKRGTPTKDTLSQYLDPANQIQRLRTMIGFGMINRVYNYINTGSNTEVLNLDLSFKNFYYYVPLWPGTFVSPNQVGIGNTASAGALQATVATATSAGALNLNGLPTISVDRVLNQIFGATNVPAPGSTTSNSDYFQRIGMGGSGMNTLPLPSMLKMAISHDQQERTAKYSYYQADQLQKDMLVIDLEIRGDPIWLMSAYANGSISPLKPLPDKLKNDVVIVPKCDRAIFLRMNAPAQADYMNPSRVNASSNPMILGGFYQVLTVSNTFTGGKFTQKLNCSKYEHLNYIEQYSEKGYGKLFLIPPGFQSPNAGAAVTNPATVTGNPSSGAVASPDTQTIITPASPGVLPVFAPSNPNAGSSNLGLANNNPGNMRPGGNWNNTVGTNAGFDVYSSPEAGVQNMWKNLVAYNNSGKNTVASIISTWAPSSDGNNTTAYINQVAASMGVGPNQPLDFTNKPAMNTLMSAIITQEVGPGTMYTPAYINTSLGW